MAASKVTSISAGSLLYEILANDETVKGLATRIYPLYEDDGKLPYCVYACIGMDQTAIKAGKGSDHLQMQIDCYAATYAESVTLAEAIRSALDRRQTGANGLTLNCSILTDRVEAYDGDAFVQILTFALIIN